MAAPEESTTSLISERDNFARYVSPPPELLRGALSYASFVTFNPFPFEA